MPQPVDLIARLELVADVLGISSHVLRRDPHQLASQLLGRVKLPADIADKIRPGTLNEGRPWLRPTRPSLTAPGGALGATFAGHESWISCVAVFPDGSHMVSGSSDGTLRVWDLKRGFELVVLSGAGAEVEAVAVSPNAEWVASGLQDGIVRIWDWASGRLVSSMEGHEQSVNALAFSPQGRFLLSASDDRTVRVWDLASFSCHGVMENHTGAVEDVAVTPDGRRAISASLDKTLRVWDIESGTELAVLDGSWPQYAVAVAPDGRRAVSGSELVATIWDLSTYTRAVVVTGYSDTLHEGNVQDVAVTPDGRFGVSGDNLGVIKVWDLDAAYPLRQDQLLATWKGHLGGVNDLAVTPDGRWAVSASSDSTLRMWSLREPAQGPERRQPEAPVKWIGFGPHGEEVIAAVRYMDTDDGPEWESAVQIGDDLCIKDYSRIRSVDQSADGRRVVVGIGDELMAVDVPDRKRHSGPRGSILSSVTPDGRRVLFFSSWEMRLGIWKVDEQEDETIVVATPEALTMLTVTGDGRWGVVALGDGQLQGWDLHDVRRLETFEGHDGPIRYLTSYPSGVLTVGSDGTVRGWNFSTRSCEFVLEADGEDLLVARSSRDGSRVVAVSRRGAILAWELPCGWRLVGVGEGSVKTRGAHQTDIRNISGVAVALVEGHPWALGCRGDTASLWDLSTGSRLASFTGDEEFESCAVSPDGCVAVVGTVSGARHRLKIEGS